MAIGASETKHAMRPDYEVGNCRLYLELHPLVVLQIGNTDGAAITDLLARFDERVLARKANFVTITDCRSMTSVPSADVRRAIADWMKKNEHERSGLGAVTILDSALVRGALTAIYWMVQPPVPQSTAANWTEAHRWALSLLDGAGVPVRPTVREASAAPY